MTASFDPRPVAARFWERAGVTEPFPRRLAPTIAAILPVAVVLLPKLTVARMAEWLARRGAGCLGQNPDRPLRGCLVAQTGHAFIFVDGSLPEDEQRLTLAHETAHFLHHYEGPRGAALALLGPSIEPVLNGDRPATPGERLRGALRSVPLGIYEHTLERSDEGVPDPITVRLESEADLLGFELLAPSAVVANSTRRGDGRRRVLAERFGLPEWAAQRWGSWLDARGGGDGFIMRLQAARKKSSSTTSNSGGSEGSTVQALPRGRRT